MKTVLAGILGLFMGALLVWLLFRSTDWPAVANAITHIDWVWLLLAQIPLFLTFPARVQRWSYIVRATDDVSYRKLFSSTQIGILGNFVLPARAGEAIRALTLTRLADIPFSKTLAFVTLDRVTDLFGFIGVVIVSILAFHPEQDVVVSAETFGTPEPIVLATGVIRFGALATGAALSVMIGSLALLYFRRASGLALIDAVLGRLSRRLADVVMRIFEHFLDGLAVFRSPADMLRSLAWSFATWGLAMLAMAALLEAFSIDYPWFAPFVIQALVSVFISAPSTPGFVGQFHVPVVLGLLMTTSTVTSDGAKAFAIVYHLIQLPPVFILGIVCLLGERMNLLRLKSEGDALAQGTGIP